jgi:Uma2 family endonuclease
MSTHALLHRFTVDDYHRMAEAGILTEDDRVELIEGRVVQMSPIGNPHQASVDRCCALLVPSLQGRAIVRIQGSVVLDDFSEPQPDVLVLRPHEDFYASRSARPGDVLLLIEVADSSERFDRHVRLPLYAAAGIDEVWIVSVGRELVTVHCERFEGGYRRESEHRPPEVLIPRALPEVHVPVGSILP